MRGKGWECSKANEGTGDGEERNMTKRGKRGEYGGHRRADVKGTEIKEPRSEEEEGGRGIGC